ncbi:hypothetical protein ACOMHN_053518 [Nucella lapillus]
MVDSEVGQLLSLVVLSWRHCSCLWWSCPGVIAPVSGGPVIAPVSGGPVIVPSVSGGPVIAPVSCGPVLASLLLSLVVLFWRHCSFCLW